MDRVGKKRKKGMEHKRGTVNAWVAMVWVAGELNSMLNTIWNFFWIERGLGPRWEKKKEIIFKLIHGGELHVRKRNGVVVKQNWRCDAHALKIASWASKAASDR